MSGDKLKRFLLNNQDLKQTAYAPILIKPKQPLEVKLDDPDRLLLCKLQNRHQRLISSALSSANPLSSYVDDSDVPVFVNCVGIQYTKTAFWLKKIHFLFSRGKLFGQFSVPGREKVETYSVQSVICAPKFPQNADCRGDFYICIECVLHNLKPFRFKITSNECVRHRFNNHLFLLDVRSNINSNNIATSPLFKVFSEEYNVRLDIKGFCVLKEGDAEIGTYLLIGTKKSGNPFTTTDSLSFSLISLRTIGFEYAALGKRYTDVRPLGVAENAIEDRTGNVTESYFRSLDLSAQEPLFSETPSIEISRDVNGIVENENIFYDPTDSLDQNRQCQQLQKPIRETRTTETFNLSKLAFAITKSIQVDNAEDTNSSYSENVDDNQTPDISSVPSVHSISEFSDLITMREDKNKNCNMSLSNTRPEQRQPTITIEVTPTITRADVDAYITRIRQCGFEIRDYPIPPDIIMRIEHDGTNPGTAFVVPEANQPIKLIEFIQLLETSLSRDESHCATSGGNVVDCAGPSRSRSGEAPPTPVHAVSQPTEPVQLGEDDYTQHNRGQYQIQTENSLPRLHLNNLSAVLPTFSNNDSYDPDPEQFVPDEFDNLIDTFCTDTLQVQDTSAQYVCAPDVLNVFSSIQSVSAQPNQNVISRVPAIPSKCLSDSSIQNIDNAPSIPRTVAQTDSISRIPIIPARILSTNDENCIRRTSSAMPTPSTSAQSEPPSRVPDIPTKDLSTSDGNYVRKVNNATSIPSTSAQSDLTSRMPDFQSRGLSTSDGNYVRKVNNATSIPSTSAQSDLTSRMPDFQSRGLSTSDGNYVRKVNNATSIPSTSAQSDLTSRMPDFQSRGLSTSDGNYVRKVNGTTSIPSTSAQFDPTSRMPDFQSRDLSTSDGNYVRKVNNATSIPSTSAQFDPTSRMPDFQSRGLSTSDGNYVRKVNNATSIPSTSAQSDLTSRMPDFQSRGLSTSDGNYVRKVNGTTSIPSTSAQFDPTSRMPDFQSRGLSTSDGNYVQKVNNATSIPSTSAQSDLTSRMPDFQSRGLSTSDGNYVRKVNGTTSIPSTAAQFDPTSRMPDFQSRDLSTSDGNYVRGINDTVTTPNTSAQSDPTSRMPDFQSRSLSTSDGNYVRKVNDVTSIPSSFAQSGPMFRSPDFISRDLSTSDENGVREINGAMSNPSASAQSGPMFRTPDFTSRDLSTSGRTHFPNTLNQPDFQNETANARQFDNLRTKHQPVVLSGGPLTPYTTIDQTPAEQSGSRESAIRPSSLIPAFLPSQMTSIVSLCVDEKFKNLRYIAKASDEKMDKVINTLPSMVSEEVSKQISRTVGSYFNINSRDDPVNVSAGNEGCYDTPSSTPKNQIDRPEILGKTMSSSNKRENPLPYTPPHRALPTQNLPSVNLSLSDILEDMIRIEEKKNNESAALSVPSLPYIKIQQQQRLHSRKQQQQEQDRLHHQQKRQKQEEQYQQQQLQHYLQQRQQQQQREESERQTERKRWQQNQHSQQQQQLEQEASANRLKQFKRFEEFEKWSENKQLSTNNSTRGNVQLPVPTYGRHNDLERISSRYISSIPAGPVTPFVALNPATASTIIPTPLSLKDDKWGIINYFFNTTRSNANDREVLKKSSRLVQRLEGLCSNFRAYDAAITAIYCEDFIIITFLKLEECGWLYECCKQQLTVSTLADHGSTTRLRLARQDTHFDDLTVRRECNCSNVRLFVYQNILDVFANYKGTTRLNKHDEQGLLIMERENDSSFTVMFILVHVFAK